MVNNHTTSSKNKISDPHIRKNKKKSPLLKRYYKYYLRRIQSLQEEPKAIARGFAIGVFTGCFPFFGIQMIAALVFAILFKGNKIAAMMGTWISNPFTYIPIFLFNFQIGNFILSNLFNINFDYLTDFNPDSWENLTDSGKEITLTLLIGSFFIGSIFAILAYYITLTIAKKQHKNLHNK